MSNVETVKIKNREMFVLLFILCAHGIVGKSPHESVDGKSKVEDVLNVIKSNMGELKSGGESQKYLDSFSGGNPWTADSLNSRRTTFTKDEIDKIKVNDYNVELLLESMSVGISGAELKSRRMHTNQSPGALLAQSELFHSLAAENKIPPKINYRRKRTFIPRYKKYLRYWPNGVVPYVIVRSTFSDPVLMESLITQAINHIENRTCIRFVEKPLAVLFNISYYDVVIISNFNGPGSGCTSYVGRYGGLHYYTGSKNLVNLDDTYWHCKKVETVLHELGHTLGMKHEFVRQDRDNHVTVNRDDIIESSLHLYDKAYTKLRTPFDYASTMQYQLQAASKIYPLQSITLRDPDLNFLMGGGYLSHYDVMNIIKTYTCYDGCPIKTCSNDGIRDQKCQCICPDGLTGPDCNQVINADICGGVIDVTDDREVLVQSPDFNTTFPPGGAKCYWLLKAPIDYAITIEIDELNLSWNDRTKRCYHWLEISYNLIGQPGPKYCGDSFPRGKVTTSKFGKPNLMMLKLDTESVSGIDQTGGFKLRAKAYDVYNDDVPSPGCPAPPSVANAVNNVAEVGRNYGAIVTYKCVGDHTLFGQSPYITCHADGTWTNISFSCELREPVFSCDFSSDICGIINVAEPSQRYSWRRFEVDGESFFRIEPALNLEQTTWNMVDFAINTTLRAYTDYCIAVSVNRPLGRSPCTAFTFQSQADLNNIRPEYQAIFISIYCYDTEWITFKSSFTPDEETFIYVSTVTSRNQPFNLDIDNIVIREGRCE